MLFYESWPTGLWAVGETIVQPSRHHVPVGTSSAVNGLIARQGIAAALAMHSRGVDRADANLLAAAYHPDATVDYGFFVGAAADLVPMLVGAQKAGPTTLHRTGNMWIRIDGDRAVSESYVIAFASSTGEDARERLIGGRYLDCLEARGGEWRLSQRTYVLDWNVNRPSTAIPTDPPVALGHFVPSGGHAAADPGRALLAFHAARYRHKEESPMPVTTSGSALDAALAKQALHDLSMAYARGVDRGDEALIASAFHPDATVVSGIVNGAAPDFAREIVAYVTANTDYCFHSIANEWFEVSGDGAIGESYVIAMITADGRDVMTGGRYIDSFERRDGTWKIASRVFVQDWATNNPASGQTGGMFETLTTRGSFGRSDPVYAHWAA